jgi:hypothetical protein
MGSGLEKDSTQDCGRQIDSTAERPQNRWIGAGFEPLGGSTIPSDEIGPSWGCCEPPFTYQHPGLAELPAEIHWRQLCGVVCQIGGPTRLP